ncbi:MAG: hypothetical protein V1489_02210 [Candidatus Liptonbacteria bacterium]
MDENREDLSCDEKLQAQGERLANMGGLPFMVDTQLMIERKRIAVQVRHSHLARQGRTDQDTEDLLAEFLKLEEFIDNRVAERVKTHPAYPWFSRVKGIGKENIGKVVGLVDITKAATVSALWAFAGYDVVNGRAPRREKGEKLSYNSTLRTMCWRVGGSLMKAKGKFYDYYTSEKEKLVARLTRDGKKIVPTTALPKKDGKHYEPEGLISEGHVHMMAFRKMIKLFLSLLWHEWRKAEGLPTRVPYPVEYMGHSSIVDPWEMVDKPEKKSRRKVA